MGGVLYRLIDIGDDPTGFVGTQPNAEDVHPTPFPSINAQQLPTSAWFQNSWIAD